MSFPNMLLTTAGRNAVVNTMLGGSIKFTKIQIGNGEEPDDVTALTELQNAMLDIDILSIETGAGIANVSGTFDNVDLTAGFYWHELGLYFDNDGTETLYAYAYAGDTAEYIPIYNSSNLIRTTLNISVVVGDATNVTAVLGEYSGYASKEDFENHIQDMNNPHQVSKSQVGLGNVENYSFSNAPITFDDLTTTLTTISSGITIGNAFAYLKMTISSLLTHLSASNPHGITYSTIGAAASSHTHNATSDLTSGYVSIARGGTGATKATTAFSNLISGSVVSISNGGTGASNAADARTNLGITSAITDMTGTLAIAHGGTGATTASAAFSNLISGSVVSISNGGTGKTTTADALNNLVSGNSITLDGDKALQSTGVVKSSNTYEIAKLTSDSSTLGKTFDHLVIGASDSNYLMQYWCTRKIWLSDDTSAGGGGVSFAIYKPGTGNLPCRYEDIIPLDSSKDTYHKVWLSGYADSTGYYLGSAVVAAHKDSGFSPVTIDTETGFLYRQSSSSRRYKHDITDIDFGTIKGLYDLPVVTFIYNDGYLDSTDQRDGKAIPGIIAEDLDEILPIAVNHKKDGQAEMWNNNILVPCLLGLIQDLNNRVSALEGAK